MSGSTSLVSVYSPFFTQFRYENVLAPVDGSVLQFNATFSNGYSYANIDDMVVQAAVPELDPCTGFNPIALLSVISGPFTPWSLVSILKDPE